MYVCLVCGRLLLCAMSCAIGVCVIYLVCIFLADIMYDDIIHHVLISP